MSNDKRNVFISHIHEDDKGLSDLKSLMSKNGIDASDYSITADKPNNAKSPEYIKSEILAPQIKAASVMLVYITPDTKKSDWVNWEIEYAQKNDIRIIGVWEQGEAQCEIPESLDKYADAVVGWTGERIVDAINGEIDGWEGPDGCPRETRPIVRIICQ